MKKSILVSITLGLSLSFITVNYVFGNTNYSKDNSKTHYVVDRENTKEFNDITSLVQGADTIIKAKLVSKTQESKDGLFAYDFSIENLIFGNAEGENIKVYERGFELDENKLIGQELLFEAGKDYYLFLESWEDEYYYTTIYTSVNKDAIVKIDNNGELLFKEKVFDGIRDEKELVKKVENTLKVTKNKVKKENKRLIKSKAKDINELTSLSDSIVIIKPIEVLNENKNVKLVKAVVSENIKGELQNQVTALLPSNAIVGEEYLIFGNQFEGTLRISTRNDSFFTKGTEEYNEVYSRINK
jgi:hypothetical protein